MQIDARRRGIVSGSVWMTVVPLALFFVPALNGLVGGLIGGYRIGDPWRAVVAALLPAVLVAIGLFLLFLIPFPILGTMRGAAGAAWVAVSVVGLLAGAALGGMSRRMVRPTAAV